MTTARAASPRTGSPASTSPSAGTSTTPSPDGAPLPDGVRMTMRGRIKVGVWLPFTAVQTVDGRSFTWQARVGRGPLKPLRVTDRLRRCDRPHRGTPVRAREAVRNRGLRHGPLGGDACGDRERRVRAAQRPARPRRDLASRDRRTSSSPASTSHPSIPRSESASTSTARCEPSAPCAGATPARRPSSTSRSGARSTPSAASATSCSPAARASAGGSAPRATSRSSSALITDVASGS